MVITRFVNCHDVTSSTAIVATKREPTSERSMKHYMIYKRKKKVLATTKLARIFQVHS